MEKNEREPRPKRTKAEISTTEKSSKKVSQKSGQNNAGSYEFRVTLRQDDNPSQVWRELSAGGNHTLDQFQAKIQEAFAFDNNQVSAFFTDGKPYSKDAYYSEISSKGPYMKDFTIGDIQFKEKDQWLYIFDFGAEWTFDVEVIKVNPSLTPNTIEITNKNGEPPTQLDQDDQESFSSEADEESSSKEEDSEDKKRPKKK